MTFDQWTIVAIIAAALGLFIWGRYRYDVVAMIALTASVIVGAIPPNDAFRGFGHPAVVTVIAVLIISRAIAKSGALQGVIRQVSRASGTTTGHVGALTVAGASFSAFMNNVGSLALLLPVAIQSALKAKRPVALVLMPLSFATLLGGLITMIGTPPNLIISAYRETETGEPFGMFDFTPVGLGIAVVGILFVTLVGWRLLPKNRKGQSHTELFRIEDYISELRILEESELVGRTVLDLRRRMDGNLAVMSLIRGLRKILAPSPIETLQAGDVLVVETDPTSLRQLVRSGQVELRGGKSFNRSDLESEKVVIMEAMIPPASAMIGRTPSELHLHGRFGINLIGLARHGRTIQTPLGRKRLEVGDVILVQGDSATLIESLRELGCFPLADRGLNEASTGRSWLPAAIFGAAIGVTAVGLLPVHAAFMTAVVALVLTSSITLREVYSNVEWPIVILLGAMLPVGQALDSSGAASAIAMGLVGQIEALPPGVILLVLFVMTMVLTDVINNNAAAVIMAPIAVNVADALGVNTDPFLMAIAVSASCAFLTPIGHQSNTLVMGPGGYRFTDYWRMGLPLEMVITATGVPLILYFWPL
ncbi:SLC13 family permease [Fodinicurvata sp. EGI_FJ10296]|uniref:SLC13 family permease n=1 Tax=Fodinicurvata sp. EGI_FJ10296 TaxID=3231908 RepID=UPI003452FCAC